MAQHSIMLIWIMGDCVHEPPIQSNPVWDVTLSHCGVCRTVFCDLMCHHILWIQEPAASIFRISHNLNIHSYHTFVSHTGFVEVRRWTQHVINMWTWHSMWNQKGGDSMKDIRICSHSSVAADWGLLGCDAKMKALQSFQTSRTTHAVIEGHTSEVHNLQHETLRNKHATKWIFCLPAHPVWCPWNRLVLLWYQTILSLHQLGEWYVLLVASLQDTIHSNQVDQLQRWFCENTLSHLSSPGQVSHCAQPGGNVRGIKIITNIKIMNTHGLCCTLHFNILHRMDFTCQGNKGHKRKKDEAFYEVLQILSFPTALMFSGRFNQLWVFQRI